MKKNDLLLVEELKDGKEKTLKSFYEEYFALFVSFANTLLPSEEECKDVVHDVFLKYWDIRNDFDNLVAIRAFFYKSIRNTCLNQIRHQQVQNKYLAENLQYLERNDHKKRDLSYHSQRDQVFDDNGTKSIATRPGREVK